MTTITQGFQADDNQFEWDFDILQGNDIADEDLSLKLDRFFDDICEFSGLQDERMEDISRSSIPNASSVSPRTVPTSEHLSLSMAGTGLVALEHATKEDSPCHIAASPASFAIERCQTALAPQSQQSRTSNQASRDAPADQDASENNSTASPIAEQQERAASIGCPSSEDRCSRSSSTSSIYSLPSLISVPSSARLSKPTQEEAKESSQEISQGSIVERKEGNWSFTYTDLTANQPTLPETPAATPQTRDLQTPEADGSSSNGLSDSARKRPDKGTKPHKRKRSTASSVAEYGAHRRRSEREKVEKHWENENTWICQVRDTCKDLIAESNVQLNLAKAKKQRLLKESDAEISRLETEAEKLSTFMGDILVWGKEDQLVSTQL